MAWPVYTDEMDRFIDSNVSDGMPYEDVTILFNEKFGTSKTKDAIAQHGLRIGSLHGRFTTQEQRDWIKDHCYVEGHDLQRLFNEKFGTSRSYRFIRNQRQKLHAHRNKTKGDME